MCRYPMQATCHQLIFWNQLFIVRRKELHALCVTKRHRIVILRPDICWMLHLVQVSNNNNYDIVSSAMSIAHAELMSSLIVVRPSVRPSCLLTRAQMQTAFEATFFGLFNVFRRGLSKPSQVRMKQTLNFRMSVRAAQLTSQDNFAKQNTW